MNESPTSVLFLCVANSARSQMAEALARALAPENVAIWSAGSEPAGEVNPLAIRALAEIGIDIRGAHPKGLDAIPTDKVQVAVTLCAEEVCPVFPGPVQRLHWPLPDPASAVGDEEARFTAFRETRDQLREKIAALFGTARSS